MRAETGSLDRVGTALRAGIDENRLRFQILALTAVGWTVLFPRRLDYACHAVSGVGLAYALSWLIGGSRMRPGTVSLLALAVVVVAEAGVLGDSFDAADVAVTMMGVCVGVLVPRRSDRRDVLLPVIGIAAIVLALFVRHWYSQGAIL